MTLNCTLNDTEGEQGGGEERERERGIDGERETERERERGIDRERKSPSSLSCERETRWS